MTDRMRLLALLKERGERGVHTSEIRRLGISANASQRRIELLDEGYSIDSIRESFIGADGSKRPGARFILTAEPDDGLDGDEGGFPAPPAAPPASEQPVAVEAGAEPPALFDVPESVDTDRYMDLDSWEAAA